MVSLPPLQLVLHLPYEQAAIEAPALAHRLALSSSVCARGACCAFVAQTYSLPPLPRQLQFRVRLRPDRMLALTVQACWLVTV